MNKNIKFWNALGQILGIFFLKIKTDCNTFISLFWPKLERSCQTLVFVGEVKIWFRDQLYKHLWQWNGCKGLIQPNHIGWFILSEKCPYSKFFWSVFSRIRTEYGAIPISTKIFFPVFVNPFIVTHYIKY